MSPRYSSKEHTRIDPITCHRPS